MSKHVPPPEGPKDIEKIELKDALEERYLAYALSTIMHRALPDVRDGLKPVHRRLLHVMQMLRLDPTAAFKKSAKIVGDVMGGYHPMATSRSMTRSCASRRISPRVIRWSTGRGTSATSTATVPPPTATPKPA